MGTAARISEIDVGGWLLRCNPKVWDVDAALGAGVVISGWRVVPSYRLELIRADQPVALWVTGPRTSGRRGIWFAGHMTGEIGEDVGDEHWVDEEEQNTISVYAGVRLAAVNPWITSARIEADPRTQNLEVIRAPQIANPSYITSEEHEALADLMVVGRGSDDHRDAQRATRAVGTEWSSSTLISRRILRPRLGDSALSPQEPLRLRVGRVDGRCAFSPRVRTTL